MLVLNLAVNPTILHAQEPTTDVPTITIRANTRLVVVDVVVTDKKGQPVTGLKAEDFTLDENGKKQRIATFTPPDATQAAAQPLPPGIISNRPEFLRPAGTPTVLLLDAANSQFKDQAYARSQMLKYVAEQSDSGTPTAVMTLTDRLHMLQDFTTDPRILIAAIKNFKPAEPILQSAPPPPGDPASSTSGAAGQGLLIAQAAIAGFANIQLGYDLERRTLITIGAMRSLSRVLGGLPGRKSVVWLTADIPFDLIPEDRTVTDAELLADLPSVKQKSIGTTSAGSLAAEARSLHGQAIKEAESQLASANIAIYPVDVRGLVGGMDAAIFAGHHDSSNDAGTVVASASLAKSQQLVPSQETMREVAAETGGKAYMNQNDIKQGVALAVADDKASYLIGYYPENKKWDGKYRSLKVKVAQGDIEVRYRKGYFAIDSSQEKNANYEQDVAAALQINAPATQVSFMAQAKPTDPGKMRVVFLVDAHTLSAEDSGGGKKLRASLFATVYDSSGKMLGNRSVKVDRAFDPATYQQILDKGMMVPIDLEIPPGGNQLRLAVLDDRTGFVGTAIGPLGQ
jgi:VWFA-related protein